MSADFRVADNLDPHVGISLPLQAVIQVKNKSGFGTFGEGVAMDSATFGSRYLGFYLISVQKNGIISRFCRFILVREGEEYANC